MDYAAADVPSSMLDDFLNVTDPDTQITCNETTSHFVRLLRQPAPSIYTQRGSNAREAIEALGKEIPRSPQTLHEYLMKRNGAFWKPALARYRHIITGDTPYPFCDILFILSAQSRNNRPSFKREHSEHQTGMLCLEWGKSKSSQFDLEMRASGLWSPQSTLFLPSEKAFDVSRLSNSIEKCFFQNFFLFKGESPFRVHTIDQFTEECAKFGMPLEKLREIIQTIVSERLDLIKLHTLVCCFSPNALEPEFLERGFIMHLNSHLRIDGTGDNLHLSHIRGYNFIDTTTVTTRVPITPVVTARLRDCLVYSIDDIPFLGLKRIIYMVVYKTFGTIVKRRTAYVADHDMPLEIVDYPNHGIDERDIEPFSTSRHLHPFVLEDLCDYARNEDVNDCTEKLPRPVNLRTGLRQNFSFEQ